MSDPQRLSSSSYWDNRYRDDRTGWDLGQAPQWLEEKANALSSRRVLVVGSGHGHDARAFAKAGHQVVGVDFAPRAIAAATELAAGVPETQLRFLQANVFDLGQGEHADLAGGFDLVWEQTCLCAIDPQRRSDYFAAINRVLAPKGQWHAVLWVHHEESGPPFHLDEAMVETMVPPGWTREHFEELRDSHPERSLQHLVNYLA